MVAVLLRFFKDPRNDEIALQHFFFSFLQQRKNFFSITFVLHAIFFFRQALAGNFFSKSPTIELNGWPLRSRIVRLQMRSFILVITYITTRTRRTPTSSCLSVLMWFSMTRQKKLQEREAQRLLRS